MSITISEDVPLEDVLAEVRRVYGVDVQVVGSDGSVPEPTGIPREGGDGRPDPGARNKQDRT